MYCQKCGYNLGDSNFCPMCGTKVLVQEQTFCEESESKAFSVASEKTSESASGNPFMKVLKIIVSGILGLLAFVLCLLALFGFWGGGWEDAGAVALVLLLPGFLCDWIRAKLQKKTKRVWIGFALMIVVGLVLCATSANNEAEPKADQTETMAAMQVVQCSDVQIAAVEQAVKTAFDDTSITFMVNDVDNGKTFLAMFGGQNLNEKIINGFADEEGNICWIEYRIQDFDPVLFEELTVDQLVNTLNNYSNIPVATLVDSLDVIAYSYIVGCIEADAVPSAYNLHPVLDARESEQIRGGWAYNTSMDSNAMLIRAEYRPE